MHDFASSARAIACAGAKVGPEIQLHVEGPVTQRSVLEALEAQYRCCEAPSRSVTQGAPAFLRFCLTTDDYFLSPPDTTFCHARGHSGAEPLLNNSGRSKVVQGHPDRSRADWPRVMPIQEGPFHKRVVLQLDSCAEEKSCPQTSKNALVSKKCSGPDDMSGLRCSVSCYRRRHKKS